MKGKITWYQVTCTRHEFMYEQDSRDFDTSEQSIRDTIVNLLLHDWDNFGGYGDSIVIDKEDEEDA